MLRRSVRLIVWTSVHTPERVVAGRQDAVGRQVIDGFRTYPSRGSWRETLFVLDVKGVKGGDGGARVEADCLERIVSSVDGITCTEMLLLSVQ